MITDEQLTKAINVLLAEASASPSVAPFYLLIQQKVTESREQVRTILDKLKTEVFDVKSR